MRIELPLLPARELSPNWRGHWSERARATKELRLIAWFYARKAKPDNWQPLDQAIIRITYIVPDRRRRDPDNWLAMSKSAIDGCVSAGVLKDDDKVRYEPVEFVVDKARSPMTTIEIEVRDE